MRSASERRGCTQTRALRVRQCSINGFWPAVAFMKISRDYHDFIDKLDAHYPRFREQYKFAFDYEPEADHGRGL